MIKDSGESLMSHYESLIVIHHFRYYDKTDQNLGLTISSSGVGGSVAVCAPQFQLKHAEGADKEVTENVELGKCFILDSDLEPSSKGCFKSPCEDMLFRTTEDALEGKYTHAGYQFCAAGYSVDWGNETDELVLGLPGALNYAGNLVSMTPPVESGIPYD